MKTEQTGEAWNKGKLVGQKPPFNLAIDSKLRGCDLVSLRVRDVTRGNQVLPRALIVQRKTQRPVQFELTEPTRLAVGA
jgi:hypothetical protein